VLAVKFTWKETGDRVFDGPDKSQGLLTCWSVATLKTLQAALKVTKVDDLNIVELQLTYYVLTIRREDERLLPFRRFPELTMSDFRIADHVVESLDQDGDCGNCNQPLESPFHTAVLLPPTNQTPEDPTVVAGELVGE
jgi:hypothetical protein